MRNWEEKPEKPNGDWMRSSPHIWNLKTNGLTTKEKVFSLVYGSNSDLISLGGIPRSAILLLFFFLLFWENKVTVNNVSNNTFHLIRWVSHPINLFGIQFFLVAWIPLIKQPRHRSKGRDVLNFDRQWQPRSSARMIW